MMELMELSFEQLKTVVNGVRMIALKDDKVYIADRSLMLIFAGAGAQVVQNQPQQGGGWVTTIQVGTVRFIHASPAKIL